MGVLAGLPYLRISRQDTQVLGPGVLADFRGPEMHV